MKTTTKSIYLCMILLAMAASMNLTLAKADGVKVTKILHHGKIFTGDSSNKWAEAIVIKNRFIVYAGDNEGALKFANANSQIIDLQGKLVIPGINDAHMHILPYNSNGPLLISPEAMLGPGPTLEELLYLLEQATMAYPAGTWLYAPIGWLVNDTPQVTRFLLDEVAPNHPVVLPYMHSLIVNTLALQTVGISETEPDPFGGVYERFPGTDVLNGRLHEYALYNFIRRVTMQVPIEQLRQMYQQYIDDAVSLGVTSVQDLPIGLTNQKAVEVLAGMDLKMRVRVINLPMTMEEADQWSPGFQIQPFWSKLTTTGVKWFHDGTVIDRLGAVTEPYIDRPGWYGMFNFPLDVYQQIVADGLKSPGDFQQRVFHTFGDRAIDNLLNAMSNTAPDRRWVNHRVQLIHGDMIREDHIASIKIKGLIVVQNPTHLAVPHLFMLRYGPERMAWVQPLKTLVDAGIPLALGSDGIGAIISPFVDIMFAVIHPTRPTEGLTVEQALMAYTSGSAYAEFKDHVKGTLKPGMLADLAVLSQDIFSIPPDQFPVTFSLLTIVDGEIVHNVGAL